MNERSLRVVALVERLGRLTMNEGYAGGLNPVQWEALRYLARANRFSRTPTGLTGFLGSTKGTVSQTLMALGRRGLVRKRPNPTDGRAVALELTAAGRRILDTDPLAEMQRTVDALSPTSQAQLESGLGRLLKSRLAATGGSPFGICHSCRYFERNSPDGAPHRCRLLDVALSDEDSGLVCVEQVS